MTLLLSQAHVVQHGPSTHPDMRRVTWGQFAQTTTREVSFALLLMNTQLTIQSALRHMLYYCSLRNMISREQTREHFLL
jgi:hypothetical protein